MRTLLSVFVILALSAIPAIAADTVGPMITDPPVVITNDSDQPIMVEFYAEMGHLEHLIKGKQVVQPHTEAKTAKDGIHYYAKRGDAQGGMDQDNAITVLVFQADNPDEPLAARVIHKKLWDAKDIGKDDLETLRIVYGADGALNVKVEP